MSLPLEQQPARPVSTIRLSMVVIGLVAAAATVGAWGISERSEHHGRLVARAQERAIPTVLVVSPEAPPRVSPALSYRDRLNRRRAPPSTQGSRGISRPGMLTSASRLRQGSYSLKSKPQNSISRLRKPRPNWPASPLTLDCRARQLSAGNRFAIRDSFHRRPSKKSGATSKSKRPRCWLPRLILTG